MKKLTPLLALLLFGCMPEDKVAEDFTTQEFTSGIEGPAYKDSILYVVNYKEEGTIGQVDANGKCSLYLTLPKGSTGNAIRFNKAGDMYIADYTGHRIWVADTNGDMKACYHSIRMNQPNDIAITDSGVVFATDPNWADSTGNLWRVSPNGGIVLLDSTMGTTNGIEISPDGHKLYVNESVQRKIWVYDLDQEGKLSNKTLFYEFDDFGLDGMKCDIHGNLYVARYGKGTVVVIHPKGLLYEEITLLGKKPTNLTFGGLEGTTVFVTMQEKGSIETFVSDFHGAKIVPVKTMR
jgi:sugar lactone lactonase YvrE